jgi:type III pantothenate kinase
MILELDIGNSQAKWRLLDSSLQVRLAGRGSIAEWLHAEIPNAWKSDAVRRIRAASVVSVDVERELAGRVSSALGLPIEYARAAAMSAGVRNGYVEPSTLGVDRWLAALAAHNITNAPVLIADIGSALTIDVIDRDGCHCGGYIIPGPRLMQSSLLRDTERVCFPEFTSLGDLGFGRDTAACVVGGIGAAQVGAVLVGLQRARVLLGGEVQVFLTGGWSLELSECLREVGCGDLVLAPELVLDGLRWALP